MKDQFDECVMHRSISDRTAIQASHEWVETETIKILTAEFPWVKIFDAYLVKAKRCDFKVKTDYHLSYKLPFRYRDLCARSGSRFSLSMRYRRGLEALEFLKPLQFPPYPNRLVRSK